MKEAFIHHIWRLKCIDFENLHTYHGSAVEIINFGKLNQHAGPDFTEAELVIGSQLWVGSVEMHVNSSDWDLHHHSTDPSYQNVILHVVWNHDKEIASLRARNVETLVIRDFVKKEVVYNYQQILAQDFQSIACKNLLQGISWDKISLWFERLMIERLEEKSKSIQTIFQQANHHWEEVTFRMLASNFGLKINQEAFEYWSNSFPYSVLQKNQHDSVKVEALCFGQAGFLEEAMDDYTMRLKTEYDFLRHKYHLTNINSSIFKFSSLRPLGFPTIRLAQLAAIYSTHLNVFSKLISFQHVQEIEEFFLQITPHAYWNTHYVFGKESKLVAKTLAKSKIHNLIINTILPLRFSYEKTLDEVDVSFYLNILEELRYEENSVITLYKNTGFPIHDAKDSQVILHLKKWYCDEKKCLNCAIGTEVLKP